MFNTLVAKIRQDFWSFVLMCFVALWLTLLVGLIARIEAKGRACERMSCGRGAPKLLDGECLCVEKAR